MQNMPTVVISGPLHVDMLAGECLRVCCALAGFLQFLFHFAHVCISQNTLFGCMQVYTGVYVCVRRRVCMSYVCI